MMRPVKDVNRLNAIRCRYNLDRPFIFYIGGLDRRKNVDTLIKAVALTPIDWTLAIAGQVRTDNPRIFPNLRRVASEAGVADRVRFLGVVPEEHKPALYSAADLFVFPSLYEGFGLTPLEAMACGTPVLCSNASSLPEVVGDGGLLFDPTDAAGLARLIAETVASPATRAELRRRGMRRAEHFSWQKVATATRRIYEEVHLARRESCASPGLEAD
jgi:glycosyltransferase involved in cell wall biosynthesis